MMMKIILLYVFFYFLVLQSNIFADDDPNVLSYYAVGNVLDGQPLVDSENLLRFYPVFKFRDVTTLVKVTVYYGSLVYTRDANIMDDGRYWEVLLPHFNLGESIQRLDVETHFFIIDDGIKEYSEKAIRYEKIISEKLKIIETNKDDFKKRIEVIIEKLKTELEKLVPESRSENESLLKDINEKINIDSVYLSKIKNLLTEIGEGIKNSENEDKINKKLEALKRITDSDQGLGNSIKDLKIFAENFEMKNKAIEKSFKDIEKVLNDFKNSFSDMLIQDIVSIKDTLSSLISDRLDLEKVYKQQLLKDINNNIAGISKQAGPSITESDIIIDIKHDTAFVKVLYRNYKKELRQLVALDPAEKMGIFRLRYIPFPIIGNKLYKPFTANSIAVFEVGLGFGNVPVSGDEFVKPTLSFDRLGVAFAISNQLFSDSAQVLALALTYDFNVYGSLGVGANFKSTSDPDSDDVQPYYSFGINKKAFELLVTALGKFFGIQ